MIDAFKAVVMDWRMEKTAKRLRSACDTAELWLRGASNSGRFLVWKITILQSSTCITACNTM